LRSEPLGGHLLSSCAIRYSRARFYVTKVSSIQGTAAQCQKINISFIKLCPLGQEKLKIIDTFCIG